MSGTDQTPIAADGAPDGDPLMQANWGDLCRLVVLDHLIRSGVASPADYAEAAVLMGRLNSRLFHPLVGALGVRSSYAGEPAIPPASTPTISIS